MGVVEPLLAVRAPKEAHVTNTGASVLIASATFTIPVAATKTTESTVVAVLRLLGRVQQGVLADGCRSAQ